MTRWTRQYRDSQTDDLPEMERLIEFLPETLPEQSRTSIVHGDYRIDNVVFDGDGTLTAVLDWELATLGDPLADFSYLAMQWMMPADGGAGLPGSTSLHSGFRRLMRSSQRYSRAFGRARRRPARLVFRLQPLPPRRHRPGHQEARDRRHGEHAKAAEMAERVPMLAAAAWSFAEKAGA